MKSFAAVWISLCRWRWWRDAGAEIARRASGSVTLAQASDIEALRERMRDIERVAHWVPRSRCLDRALSLVEWADAHAIPVQLCIGVQRNSGSLRAHAWVQCGEIILDPDPEATTRFSRMDSAVPGMRFDR